MSYFRVIPRDLFNEANLLKCYGNIYIQLERLNAEGVELLHNGEPFEVEQDEHDGSTYVSNVDLVVRGVACQFRRPLNSREAWPLYMLTGDYEEISVFHDDGSFSVEMLEFLEGKAK